MQYRAKLIRSFAVSCVILLALSMFTYAADIIPDGTVYERNKKEIAALSAAIEEESGRNSGIKDLPEYELTQIEREDMNRLMRGILSMHDKEGEQMVYSSARFNSKQRSEQYYFKFLSFMPRYVAIPYCIVTYRSDGKTSFSLAFQATSQLADTIISGVQKEYKEQLETVYRKEIRPYESHLSRCEILALIENVVADKFEYEMMSNPDNLNCSIRTGYGVCGDYSYLFDALARKAGFKCRIVYGDKADETITDKHSWNAVFLNGSWHFVDCVADDAGSKTGKNLIDKDGNPIYSICSKDGDENKAKIIF